MTESKCYYPDWEGGFIIKGHIIGKDGYCGGKITEKL